VQQGLIKWSSSPDSLTTCEDLEPLKERFPAAPAWGQATPKEGGVVTEPATLAGELACEAEVQVNEGNCWPSGRLRRPNECVS
jgi:hypothetical protein